MPFQEQSPHVRSDPPKPLAQGLLQARWPRHGIARKPWIPGTAYSSHKNGQDFHTIFPGPLLISRVMTGSKSQSCPFFIMRRCVITCSSQVKLFHLHTKRLGNPGQRGFAGSCFRFFHLRICRLGNSQTFCHFLLGNAFIFTPCEDKPFCFFQQPRAGNRLFFI